MIKPLNPHYSLENPGSVSIYDEEAMTALELSGRTLGKVNECVEVVNQIPNTVSNAVQKHIDQGDFDKQIDEHTDELTKALNTAEANFAKEVEQERVNNQHIINDAVGALTSRLDNALGGLTQDSEVIDGRTDVYGRVHASLGAAIRDQLKKCLRDMTPQNSVRPSNASEILPDADLAEGNTYVILNLPQGSTEIANLPWAVVPANHHLMCLFTIKMDSTGYGMQFLINCVGDYQIYYRTCAQSYWEWKQINKTSDFLKYVACITTKNYEEKMPTFDNAPDMSIYSANFATGATLPGGLPWETNPAGNELFFIFTMNSEFSTYGMQMLFNYRGGFYQRFHAGSWLAWQAIRPIGVTADDNGERHSIIVGPNGKFTKLTDALKYAKEYGNVDMYVQAGTYDIIEELGASYFESYAPSYGDLADMTIGNNNHYIFAPGAKVVCHYTGSNQNVRTYFSPFNSLLEGHGSFVIDGLNLSVSGCRYAIHDDISGDANQESHIYKNCDITCDTRAIGAGFGSNMYVEIRDCIFRTSNDRPMVSWHNSIVDGANKMVVTGCVFEGSGNTLQVTHYGDYTTITEVLASNNVWSRDMVLAYTDYANYPKANIRVTKWNNVIQ